MTTSQQTTAFVAKLLAALPAGEEQPLTPEFIKLVEKDIDDVWTRAMEHVRLAEARHSVNAIEKRLGLQVSEDPGVITFRALVEAICRQCLLPAPTAKELRWKLRQGWALHDSSNRAAVDVVIAKDRARLGGAA